MAFFVRRKPCWCSCKNFRTILWKSLQYTQSYSWRNRRSNNVSTICIDADEKTFEQVKKQLNRSVEVIKVIDYTDTSIRTKEIMFIKVKSLTEKQMAEIFQMAEVFRFLIKDMGKDSLLIEAIRTETKNDSILKVFKERYTNIEVVRGGPVAIDCISMQDR